MDKSPLVATNNRIEGLRAAAAKLFTTNECDTSALNNSFVTFAKMLFVAAPESRIPRRYTMFLIRRICGVCVEAHPFIRVKVFQPESSSLDFRSSLHRSERAKLENSTGIGLR